MGSNDTENQVARDLGWYSAVVMETPILDLWGDSERCASMASLGRGSREKVSKCSWEKAMGKSESGRLWDRESISICWFTPPNVHGGLRWAMLKPSGLPLHLPQQCEVQARGPSSTALPQQEAGSKPQHLSLKSTTIWDASATSRGPSRYATTMSPRRYLQQWKHCMVFL